MILWQVSKKIGDISLTKWKDSEEQTSKPDWNYFYYFAIFSVCSAIPVVCRIYALLVGQLHLGNTLHHDMLSRVMKAPINLYHDITSSGMILNRFSKDLSSLLYAMWLIGNIIVDIVTIMGVAFICIYSIWYSVCIIPIMLTLSLIVVKHWIIAGRDIKRIETKSKTPVLNTFQETTAGSSCIYAFEVKEFYKNKFNREIEINNQAKLYYMGINQFFETNIDLIVWFCNALMLAFVYFFGSTVGDKKVALLLGETIILQDCLAHLVSSLTSFQLEAVCFERCYEMTQIIQEKDDYEVDALECETKGVLASGEITFNNLVIKYRPELKPALRKINLTIEAGQKVGVCGRTGSGKSTICLSLFRILEPTEGTIIIDGQDITKMPLSYLRSRMTIIPQDPFLFKGTLRYNIDPFGKLLDEEIMNVLKIMSCTHLADEKEEKLDFLIQEGGSNMSIGEKQLICIARAISRKSKIVVMDEATASIDVRTEELIQKALTISLKDATVITVAHRIKTIFDCDRILLLETGEVIEDGNPKELVKDETSGFFSLYTKSHH